MEVYSLEKSFRQLGVPNEGGLSSLYSSNLNNKEISLVEEMITEFNKARKYSEMKEPVVKVLLENTRILKTKEGYSCRVGSAQKNWEKVFEKNGVNLTLVNGDHSAFLK